MPVVARLSLTSLEHHRHMMSERVYADILAAKLRGCYEKVRWTLGSNLVRASVRALTEFDEKFGVLKLENEILKLQ